MLAGEVFFVAAPIPAALRGPLSGSPMSTKSSHSLAIAAREEAELLVRLDRELGRIGDRLTGH